MAREAVESGNNAEILGCETVEELDFDSLEAAHVPEGGGDFEHPVVVARRNLESKGPYADYIAALREIIRQFPDEIEAKSYRIWR